MPVMDGITATQVIRAKGHKMPIIAATASFSEADTNLCTASGMNGVLPKPFTKATVLTALNRQLKKL